MLTGKHPIYPAGSPKFLHRNNVKVMKKGIIKITLKWKFRESIKPLYTAASKMFLPMS
jgi:hypothetical protein